MSFFTLALVGANFFLIHSNQKLVEANRLMANSSVELTKLQIDSLKPKFEIKSRLLNVDKLNPPLVWSQILDFNEGDTYTLFIRYGELYNNTLLLNFFNTGHVPIALDRIRLVDDCSGSIKREIDLPVKILNSGESYVYKHDFQINGTNFVGKKYCIINYLLDNNDFKKEYLVSFIDDSSYTTNKVVEKAYGTCSILCEETAQEIIIWDKNRVIKIPPIEGVISDEKIIKETYKILGQEKK